MKIISYLLFLYFICFFSTQLSSQINRDNNFEKSTYKDSIVLIKKMGDYKIYRNNELLRLKKLKKIMESNEEAYKEIKLARSANSLGTLLQFGGGFMIGWTLGTALSGGTPNWSMAGVGAALLVVSIPIKIHSNKKLKSAVRIYNSGLEYSFHKTTNELHLTFNPSRIGICWSF